MRKLGATLSRRKIWTGRSSWTWITRSWIPFPYAPFLLTCSSTARESFGNGLTVGIHRSQWFTVSRVHWRQFPNCVMMPRGDQNGATSSIQPEDIFGVLRGCGCPLRWLVKNTAVHVTDASFLALSPG